MKRLIKYRDGSDKTTNSLEETIDELLNWTKDIASLEKIEGDPDEEYEDFPF